MNSSSLIASLGENSRRYESELRQLQLELSNAHEQELRLQHSISGTFGQIASYQLAGGAQVSSEVQRLLDQRGQAEAELRDRLAVAEASVAKHLRTVSSISEEIESIVAGVDRQLAQDPLYQQHAATLAEAVALCNGAAGSYKELRDECRTKLQAFQSDPLYLYLKGRGFGTERYPRQTFWRELDRWIARLCNFSQNSESEQTLLAIQEANEGACWQHDANRAIQEAELSRLYQEALSGTLVSVLQARLTTERQTVEAGKAQANAVHERLDLYATKGDEHFAKASELLSRQLAEMSDPTLEQLAGQTTTAQDDELVRQVCDWRAELDELQRRVPFLNTRYKEAERDYGRAKQLERDLLSGGHIASGHSYSEGMKLDALLSGFMQGALSLSQVEKEVDSHRRSTTVVSHSWSISTSSSDDSSSDSSSNSASFTSSFSTTRSSGGAGFSTSDSL